MFRRWSDQWPFWSGDSLIRGNLKRTIVWAMVAQSSGQWSEVVGKCLEDGLISGLFGLGIV